MGEFIMALPTQKPSSGNEPERDPNKEETSRPRLNVTPPSPIGSSSESPVKRPAFLEQNESPAEELDDIDSIINDDEEEGDEVDSIINDFLTSREEVEEPKAKFIPQSSPAPEVNETEIAATAKKAQTSEEETVAVAPKPSPAMEIEEDFDVFSEEERRKEIAALSDDAKENARRLLERISDDESSEVLLNGPSEIMFKLGGQRYYDRNIRFEDVETYHKVINLLILHETDTEGRIGKDKFLIEGQLELPDYDNPNNPPLFARVHVIAPPVVKAAKVTIAKKAKNGFMLDDLQAKGAMSPSMALFLKACAKGKATVVFSGLSGSGKTTLLEAMSHHFDENDRVVVAEDTSELRLPLPDVVYLLSTPRKPGQDLSELVTLEWLVSQANRMRPDRIIVGEIRGGELAEFLSAANSGADGSMTTVHASSPRQTIEKMLSLAMKSATAKNETSVLRDISSTIQIIVQTALIDGRHIVSQIEEVSDTVVNNGTGIATTPLFEYDRNSGQFISRGKPSDKLTQFLAQRGVDVNPAWFNRPLSGF